MHTIEVAITADIINFIIATVNTETGGTITINTIIVVKNKTAKIVGIIVTVVISKAKRRIINIQGKSQNVLNTNQIKEMS